MKLLNTIAKIGNRTDRILGRTVNKIKDIATRGTEAMPEVLRDIRYRTKFIQYSVRLKMTPAGSAKALEMAEQGIQIGLVRNLITTSFWFIDDLRKEMADAPITMRSVSSLTSFADGEDNLGTGIDIRRLDECDVEFPIYITPEGVIIDGNHRYKKARANEMHSLPVQVVGKPHLVIFNCDL